MMECLGSGEQEIRHRAGIWAGYHHCANLLTYVALLACKFGRDSTTHTHTHSLSLTHTYNVFVDDVMYVWSYMRVYAYTHACVRICSTLFCLQSWRSLGASIPVHRTPWEYAVTWFSHPHEQLSSMKSSFSVTHTHIFLCIYICTHLLSGCIRKPESEK